MTDRLGHKQTAAMFTLMVLGREVPNPEMQKLVGFTLTGKELTQLTDAGYVTSRKGAKNAWVHELDDKGWAWCRDELGMREPPPHSRSSLVTGLYFLLSGFDEHLRRRNLSLAEVFAPGAEPSVAEEPAAEERIPEELVPEEIERRIRNAYGKLARTPRDWVGLVDVRPLLGDAPSAEVDAVLKDLSRRKQLSLVPESNRKALRAADREAAIRIGGEDNHLLRIEEP
jgi:hypothetical protein